MLNFFKNFSKEQKTLNKIRKDFDNIVRLNDKRIELIMKYDDESETPELTKTQKEILLNNLAMLGKTADIAGGFKNTDADIENGIYFNIQGTSPRVIASDVLLSSCSLVSKDKIHKTYLNRMDEDIFYIRYLETFNIVSKFLEIKSNKLNRKGKNLIHRLAEEKMKQEIIKFSKFFKGNEQLIQEFIFSGLEGEDDHWRNVYTMKDRLNLASGLRPYINNPDILKIGMKEVIYIYAPKNGNVVLKLLNRINNKNKDFIVTYHQNKGGNISD